MSNKLNWTSQQNEVGQPSKTGETISYMNVKTCEFPFGFLWAGMLVITDSKQQAISAPKFKIMFNQFVIKDDITTQEEALKAAEDWFMPRIQAMAEIYSQLQQQEQTKKIENAEHIETITPEIITPTE
jgi:hypothetical protein